MLIACDFDGTLYKDGQVNQKLIAYLRKMQKSGNIVILWTCRNPAMIAEAVGILRQYGFVPNFVNQNAPSAIKMLGHDPRKIYADIYIDDKNLIL